MLVAHEWRKEIVARPRVATHGGATRCAPSLTARGVACRRLRYVDNAPANRGQGSREGDIKAVITMNALTQHFEGSRFEDKPLLAEVMLFANYPN